MIGMYEILDNEVDKIQNSSDLYELIKKLYYLVNVLGSDIDISKALNRFYWLQDKEILNDSPYSTLCIASFEKTKKMMCNIKDYNKIKNNE